MGSKHVYMLLLTPSVLFGNNWSDTA